jgi:hypothetical protein
MDDENKSKRLNYHSSFFVNVLTNEKGQKYYLYILEYFKKYEISEFKKLYKTDTVREYMKLKSYVYDSNEKLKSSENMRIYIFFDLNQV